MEVLPILAFIALFVLAIVAGHLQQQAWGRQLAAFRDRLEGGAGRVDLGLFSALRDARVNGRLEGAPVTLRFERRGAGKHKYHVAIYEVEVDNPVADFTAEDEGALDGLWRWLGLSSTEAISQDVKLSGGAGARRLFQQQDELQRVVRTLLALPGERHGVRLSGGRLRLERRVGGAVIDADDLQRTFRLLVKVAALCGRRRAPLAIKARERAARAEAYEWTGGGADALCPYCRDGLGADLEAVACARCGTLHHAACFDEAGGCTIFGCGARATRGRAREA